jgi:AcrR family transcriptional regulator
MVTSEMPGVKASEPTKLTRRGRAKATQWRIVKAAYTLFCDRGYAGTTMADIAAAAGVAVQTIYFTFHTKAALLSRTYDFAVMGDQEPIPPEQQPWYVAMVQELDASNAISHFVAGVGEITRRVTPLELVARVAADGDPDTAKVIAFHERWRADGYRAIVELVTAKAELRPGLTLERATDLFLLYVGMDVYHALVEGRGWTHEEWAHWATAALTHQVFGGPERPGP